MASLEGKPKLISETYKYNRRNIKMSNEELDEKISDLNRRFDMLIRELVKRLPKNPDEDDNLRYI